MTPQPIYRVWLTLPTGKLCYEFEDEWLAMQWAVKNGARVEEAAITF
jgi:hypothetical protein